MVFSKIQDSQVLILIHMKEMNMSSTIYNSYYMVEDYGNDHGGGNIIFSGNNRNVDNLRHIYTACFGIYLPEGNISNGRLKNLTGPHLTQGVEDSLRSVNLLEDRDKQVGKYSGDMKRRLSIAISLIGNPKVVFMDDPTTGLDPASTDVIWDALETAKQNGAAILLTTHSMEEVEQLCDRVGIMVDGSLRCIGSPEQLKERWRQFSHDLEDVFINVCTCWSEA